MIHDGTVWREKPEPPMNRRERRRLAREAEDMRQKRAVESLVSELRTECYYVLARKFENALRELYGFGDKRIAKVLAHVKASALLELYIEKGLPMGEIIDRQTEAVGNAWQQT